MEPPIDLVSFVTRAENRVAVLLTLSTQPLTRSDLQDETDIPRATVSRILADFRERDLISRNGHQYRITPLGELIAAELEKLFRAVESMRALQTLAGWLPLTEMDVDFEELATADVELPTPLDPMAPVKRAATVVENAEYVRTFCYSVVHAPILAALRGIASKGQQLEGVVATGVIEIVGEDPDLAESARKLFESGAVELYLYEGAIEPQLVIADGRTMFLVTDDDGTIQGLVESDDGAILAWAEATFESLKQEAEPVTPEAASELLTP